MLHRVVHKEKINLFPINNHYGDTEISLIVQSNANGYVFFIDFASVCLEVVKLYCAVLKGGFEAELRQIYLGETSNNIDIHTSMFRTGANFSITAIKNKQTAQKYLQLVKSHIQAKFAELNGDFEKVAALI